MDDAATALNRVLDGKADASVRSALESLRDAANLLMSIDGSVEYTRKTPAGRHGPHGK